MVITGLEISQALIDFLLGLLWIMLVFIISSVNSNKLKCCKKLFDYLMKKWEEKFQNRLSASKGVVICNEFSDLSLNEIIKIADERMYLEKDKYYQNRVLQKDFFNGNGFL